MTPLLSRSLLPALLALASTAAAQVQPPMRSDAPPPLPPAASTSDAADGRRVITLPESERTPRKSEGEEMLTEPAPEDQLPPARVTSPEAKIEQRRRANRVIEVTVTPAGSTSSYVMINREGARTLSQQELSAGLSVPRFLRLEF
jgi:hypothetical protein